MFLYVPRKLSLSKDVDPETVIHCGLEITQIFFISEIDSRLQCKVWSRNPADLTQ